MSNLEQIIRPFQNSQASPPQQYFQAGQVGTQPVIVRFGRGGSGKLMNGSSSSNSTNYMTQYVNEKQSASFGTEF